MSGICSAHKNHDSMCPQCLAIPLNEIDKAFYEGWDESYKSLKTNGWVVMEGHVLDEYKALEVAVRKLFDAGGEFGSLREVKDVLEKLDDLRKLNRGFGK